MEGAPYKGAFPIIVELKQRREKEQLLWRSKDKLRNLEIIVTDDTYSKLGMDQQPNESSTEDKDVAKRKQTLGSPKKKSKPPKPTAEEALFGDFL